MPSHPVGDRDQKHALRPNLGLRPKPVASGFTKAKASHRLGSGGPGLLLPVGAPPEWQPAAEFSAGDKPAVSPATRRRLVGFQLGSDVVGVVDACSRARATVRVLAGGPRQGALSKRISRAERVARLRNLSADVLIANVAAPVREPSRAPARPVVQRPGRDGQPRVLCFEPFIRARYPRARTKVPRCIARK